jgi:hypothetical protein
MGGAYMEWLLETPDGRTLAVEDAGPHAYGLASQGVDAPVPVRLHPRTALAVQPDLQHVGPQAARACRRQRSAVPAPLPSRLGNSYFFPFFLPFLFFLLFFATPLTSLPDPEGQRNVDQASTYH